MSETRLILGDCLVELAGLPDASVHSLVTDPPYGINFMGKAWDGAAIQQAADEKRRDTTSELRLTGSPDSPNRKLIPRSGSAFQNRAGEAGAYDFSRTGNQAFQAWVEQWARECLRVLKPGGFALVFGGTRTSHRLACGLEDAGFEIRDEILAWTFGSGFPKSLSVHKASIVAIESRYGHARCDCVDAEDGCVSRDGIGRDDRSDDRSSGGPGALSSDPTRASDVSLNAGAGDGAVRELRQDDHAAEEARTPSAETLLQSRVRGRRAEETGHGHAQVWPRMEEPPSGDSTSGSPMPVLREDADSERSRASCASPETVSIRGHESPDESGGAVRLVPPHDRVPDDAGSGLDSHRREARRVLIDDHGGRQAAVARVCSWCGLPDREWLTWLEGVGTATKPAHEPIIVARKPLTGTVASNVLAHGTGGLNIDGCRISGQPDDRERSPGRPNGNEVTHGAMVRSEYEIPSGRWPANVVLVHHEDCQQVGTTRVPGHAGYPNGPGGKSMHYASDKTSAEVRPNAWAGHADADGMETTEVWECVEGCPVRMLDEQSGRLTSGKEPAGGFIRHAPDEREGIYGGGKGLWKDEQAAGTLFGDSGGASRFFYVAKVSRAERNAGLEGFDAKMPHVDAGHVHADGRAWDIPGSHSVERRNHHPTVKPIALMRWLVRLVTPPGGTVLDPFLGSGSTGCAVALEGFDFVGIEREADYMKIAEARIAFWAEHGEDGLRICAEREAGVAARKVREDAGQLNLLG